VKTSDLCERGLKMVEETHQPPIEVATTLIADSWAVLADGAKRQLAVVGLARVMNDEMTTRRERRVEEIMRPYREEQERIRSIHKQIDCPWTHCQDDVEQMRFCVQHLLGLSGTKLQDAIAARRQENEATRREQERRARKEEQERLTHEAELKDPAYREEIDRIHSATRCSTKCHRESFDKREYCVRSYVCDGKNPLLMPKEELAAKIEEHRELNAGMWDSIKDALEFCDHLGYHRAVKNMRSIMLICADGSMKPLLDFTLVDVRMWQKKSRANVVSWKARREFFGKLEAALTAAGVDTVCELPGEQIAELAAQAEAIWKKDQEGPRRRRESRRQAQA
jgi:hypothetical protein